VNRDHGLNVQHILNAAELADRKVDIVLKWNTDEVAYGVLRRGEHLGVVIQDFLVPKADPRKRAPANNCVSSSSCVGSSD
jgi:hypothetical protein